MDPKSLFDAWMEQVWNQRSDQFIIDHLECPCRMEGLAPGCNNPEGFTTFRNSIIAAIPDLHIQVLERIQEGDKVMGICRVTGTHKRTDEKLDFNMAASATIRDGKIIEGRNVVDFLTMLLQTKAISPMLLSVNLSC